MGARIYLPQEDPMLPLETQWFEADHWTTLHFTRHSIITFGSAVVEDKHNIFYKFTYTGEDGTVTSMIIHSQTSEVKCENEINHIKYDILKNRAKRFSEYLTAGNEGNRNSTFYEKKTIQPKSFIRIWAELITTLSLEVRI